MYKKILMTVDTTASDRAIIDHIKQLARFCGSRVVVLHVADGWAARQFGEEAVGKEITEDNAYLAKIGGEFVEAGIDVETHLAYGDPKKEIVKWVEEKGCCLVAMGTHGHRFLGDLFLGATASHVQHRVQVPVLLLRAR
jgi:nucleotide-binding universal stress UspA family protein